MIHTDRYMVATIEAYLVDDRRTDFMLGAKVRALFALRADELLGQALPQPPQPQRDGRGWPILGGGVVELPDDDSPYDPRD